MAVEKDRIDTSRTLVWGSVATVWVVIAIIALQGFFHDATNDLNAEYLAGAPATQGATLKASQKAELLTIGWTDKKAGRATIPVEAAMKLVVDDIVRPPRTERLGS